MNITNKIKVDLQKPGSTPIIYAVQTDSNVRNLEIELFNNRKAFRIPKDVQVIIRYRKFDGSGGEYDTLPDDTPAWRIQKNTLHLALVPQVLASPGSVSMTVTLICAGQQLSVFPIRLNVDGIASASIAKPENYFYVTGFLPAPKHAEIGQYLSVSDVSSTGKVTAVEAISIHPGSEGTIDESTVHKIVDTYLAENPPVTAESDPTVPDWAKQPRKPTYTAQEVGAQPAGEYILKTELPDIISDTLAQAQESGEFDGDPGKSAYEYAQEGGYTGTEEEFAEKLAKEIPKAFYVSVTGDPLNGFESDKAFEEIEQAYAAGRAVYCLAEVDGLQMLHGLVTFISEEGYSAVLFSSPLINGYIHSVVIDPDAVYVQAETITPTLKTLNIKIGDRPVVSYDGTATKTILASSLKNPYSLTINDIAYDGSSAVDMTDTINAMVDAKLKPEAELVLSDNLFDKSTAITGANWYHSSSGPSLVITETSFYAYVPLRGAGTYRTILCWAHHGESYAKRVPILKADNSFLQNVTGTLTKIDNSFGYLEFTVTEEMISNGAAVYAYGGLTSSLDTLMIVKDLEYPSAYIPYGYIELEVEGDSETGAANTLSGKTAVFLGDSICAGTTVGDDSEYYGYGWAGLIGEENTMTWKNYGRNGGTITTLSSVDTARWVPTQADAAFAEYPNTDYVLFEGGCNDADIMKDDLLGAISSDYATFDTTTFSGAFESLVLKLLTSFPTAKIGYIIPQKMYAVNDHSREGHVHRRFFDRAIEICEKWGIPYIDLWKCNPLNPKLSTASRFYTDGQHLTIEGYHRITPQIEAFMRRL